MRVLIASCIRQKPEILVEFLESLDALAKTEKYEYFFILNELSDRAHQLIHEWIDGKPVEVETMRFGTPYSTDEETHHWNSDLVDNIIEMKRRILEKAKEYDYLLLLDSDHYLHSKTLMWLLAREKDIITEITWTRWFPKDPPMPNAWFYHNYGFPTDGLKRLREEELIKVGGFGGLYLISNRALTAGVCFDRVEGLNPQWGEDRHFAVRAQALGFELWCDTTLPSFHIYRLSDLPRLQLWKKGVDIEEEKGDGVPTVLIAVPHTGNIKTELVSYLLNVVARNALNGAIQVSVDLSWGMPVDSNRNSIAKKFLETKNEYLLTIDSDNEPPDRVLEALLSHGKKIVGAVCWSSMGGEKGGPWENHGLPYPVVMAKNPKGGWNVDRDAFSGGERLVEVDSASTACVLIHRSVFEALDPPYFRLLYDEDGLCNAGEDFTFFEKAKNAGFQVFVDISLQCGHYKTMDIRRVNQLLADVERAKNVL